MRDPRTLALQQHLRNLAIRALNAEDDVPRTSGLITNIRIIKRRKAKATARVPTSAERAAEARAYMAHLRVRLEGRRLFREMGLCP